jgi:cytochrome c oxidase assembly protein subunit 15
MDRTSEFAADRLFRTLAVIAVALTIVLIGSGSTVRVTGSGMGCLDEWPLCRGSLFPPFEFTAIVEWLHRFTTTAVTVPLAGVAWLAWRRYRASRAIVVPAVLAPVFLVMQIVLGATVVKFVLPPALVAVHLANAMLVLACLSATAAAAYARPGAPVTGLETLWRWTLVTAAATYVQIVLGSVMVHIGASAACLGFPLCNGALLPANTLQAVHMAHRLVGTLAALSAAVTAWQAWRAGVYRRWTVALVVLFVVQIGLGAANVLFGFPQAVNVGHLATAATLWALLVALGVALRLAMQPAPAPAAQARPAPSTAGTR